MECNVEGVDNVESVEDPLSVWRVYNSVCVTLFRELDSETSGGGGAAGGNISSQLETMLTTIINLNNNIQDILVVRSTSQENLRRQCPAFNKWFLGRIFYILTDKKFLRIHKVSLQAQTLILSVLHSSGASFFMDILRDYHNAFVTIVNYYEKLILSKETDNSVTLNVFAPENVETVLDLTPIAITIIDKENARQVMIYLIEIWEQINLKTRHSILYEKINQEILENILNIYKTFDFKSKTYALKFFVTISLDNNLTKYDKNIETFLQITQKFIIALPLLIDDNFDSYETDLNAINLQLKFILEYCCKKDVNQIYKSVLENIVVIIINRYAETEGCVNKKCEFYDDVVSVCKQLLEKFVHTGIDINDTTITKINFENLNKTVPIIYIDKLTKDALNSYVKTNKIINMMSHSECFKNLHLKITQSLEIASKDNVNQLVFIAHLNQIYNLLNILYNFKILYHIQRKQKKLDKKTVKDNVDLIILSSDMTHSFLESLNVAIKCNLYKCNQFLNEVALVTNIFTKLLYLTHNINVSDMVTMLELQLFSCRLNDNTNWLSNLLRNSNIQFDVERQQAVLLKNLLTQLLLLPTNMYLSKLKEHCCEVFGWLVNVENKPTKLEILKLAPLLLLNNITTPEDLINNHLQPAYLSRDTEYLLELIQVLPMTVCIVSQKFTLIHSMTDTKKVNFGYQLNLAAGVQMNLRCLQCHETSNETLTVDMPYETNVKYSKGDVVRLNNLFKIFLHLDRYTNISLKDVSRILVNFSKHFIPVSTSLKYLLKSEFLEFLPDILEPFVLNILNDPSIEETAKNEILNSIIAHILKMSKSTLESGDEKQQANCLECVKQLGRTQSPLVVLPTIKLCIMFVMHYNCPCGPKAALYIRDICEAHGTTPVEVYHKYKRDFCRIIMELAAFNYLVEQECTYCIVKVVRVFGFVGFRDFISKDIHHSLPYLVPLVVKYDKLKAIIVQMASVTNCSPAEFISERFPHIYTHVYITENETDAQKCFEYIAEITNTKLIILIKKHFRIILTEFLLQYCSGPEKVLTACRWLAKNDPEYAPKQSDSLLTLSQVADFIQPRFLGVLAYFDSKLVNAKVAESIKRKALQSFPHILNLMGNQHMTPLRFKILATLRTSLTLMSDYPILNATAWNAFIHNIDTAVLGPLLSSIFVSLIPLLDSAKREINEIFDYLVVKNENLLSKYIPDLFFIDDQNVDEKVMKIILKHVQRVMPNGRVEVMKWYMKYLSHDSSGIRIYTYKKLLSHIKDSQVDVNVAMFASKDINPVIVELIDVFITGCRDKDPKISEYSGRCLGALGAVEPSLLPRHSNSQLNSDSSNPFAFSISDHHFVKQSLMELTRAFHAEKHTKNMDCYALAIQEILKTFDISPDGQNKELWNSFPDNMHQIMLPLLSSRYILSIPSNHKQIHPVYGSNQATTFNEWAFHWTSQVINNIEGGATQDVLKMVHPSFKRDLRTLVLFLPYVVLHGILSSRNERNIREEMLAVVGADSFNHDNESSGVSKYKTIVTLNFTPSITPLVHEEGTQLKCRKMVYLMLDFLNRWLLEWTHNKKDAFKDEDYIKISKFLGSFCNLTVARGNFLCGELERSLQYLEMYVEGSQIKLHEQLAFLAEIYAVLNEPDCVAGILRMKQSEPSLRELILAHKVTGQLQDAATCYEKSAQQGELDDETLQGMVEVYLGLDQPYTALSLLQGANIRAEGGLAAEPMWRLGRFEELDNLLQEPDVCEDRQWGVRVGHCLLALRKSKRDVLEDQLCTAREALLMRLGESTTSTAEIRRWYTHSYHNALGLHMLDEIEHVESSIYKIKGLPDQSAECTGIMEQVIEEWDLRLRLVQASSKTVEPVLRLRRILLEQAKELLSPSHPQTASSLNSHIGRIWLQSAKFARKASIYQQAYIYILNAEKYSPKELFIEKAKLYWERGQQEPAFYTLKRGLEEHFPADSQLTISDSKICARAKLLIAMYNDETTNVDMDVNILHYKEAVETYKEWEKSLVCLAEYYEKLYNTLSSEEKTQGVGGSARAQALNCYGRALQYGHTRLYQSMPRMLSIWLDFEVHSTDPKSQSMTTLKQICSVINTFSKRLPSYLFLTAFSQIISRICHPIKEVYDQLKSIIIGLILDYPQHSLWMMMCVIKSSYPQRIKRCQEILGDPRLKQQNITKFIYDFNQLAEKLIELCNKPIPPKVQTTHVSALVRSLPKLLASDNFSQIMMPHEQFIKVVLPFNTVNKEPDSGYNPFPNMVYISGIEEAVTVFPSLQRPRKITFKGSDGKKYNVMLKPKDDLRKDFRLMEFNGVVNRYLQENSEARERRLYIRTYSVLPLNEECGILEWVDHLTGLRPILVQLYKEKGKLTTTKELKEMMCEVGDTITKKKHVFEKMLMPKHPPVFDTWFKFTFSDPHTWYQARSAYIRTTAVMSMVGYILGLGDRHGENVLFDSESGDTVHVDFNCLFNKGESFEWPERVPFRLTHNMTHAMGPLGYEGMYRKCCEVTLRVLKSQTSTLMSVIRPFVYDPLVAWQKSAAKDTSTAERTNQLAKDHLTHIKQRLEGMVKTKDKQFSLSLSPEGQANNLILEATNVVNLCQMYIGWGPFL